MKPVRVKIEIPKGSRVKYEINKDTGVVEVNRILHFEFPYNYGFLPRTLWDDGDPLDAIILGHFSLHPGVELEAVPVAVVHMEDNGESDWKLVCAMSPVKFEEYHDLVIGFLKAYKPGVKIDGYTTEAEAIREVVRKARRKFNQSINVWGIPDDY